MKTLFLFVVAAICGLVCTLKKHQVHNKQKTIVRNQAINSLSIKNEDIIYVPLQGRSVKLLNSEFKDEEYGVYRCVRFCNDWSESVFDRCIVMGEMNEGVFLLKYLPSQKDSSPIMYEDQNCTDEMQYGDLFLASKEDIYWAIQKGREMSIAYEKKQQLKREQVEKANAQAAKVAELLS